MYSQKVNCTASEFWFVCVCVILCEFSMMTVVCPCVTLTLYDVSQALRKQQVFQASHLLLQLTHQTVVGVLVDHGVTADLFGAISVPGGTEVIEVKKPLRYRSVIPQALHTELMTI